MKRDTPWPRASTAYLGWEGTVVGDPLAAPCFGAPVPATPTPAASFDGSAGTVQTERSSEGDLDVGYITSGSFTFYSGISLNGMTTFRARVASAVNGGDMQVLLDSPTGTKIGRLQRAGHR
jgi:Carbohydrate binding module (family 6)